MKEKLLEVLSVVRRLQRLLQPDSVAQLKGATLLDLIDGYVEHCVRVGKVIPLPERQVFDDFVWAEVLFGRPVPTADQLLAELPPAPEYSTPEKYNPDRKEQAPAYQGVEQVGSPNFDGAEAYEQYLDLAEQRARAGITEQDGPATVKYKLKVALRRALATPDDIPEPAPKSTVPAGIKLSADQEKAWVKIQRWVRTDYTEHPYFLLRGYAGTGKCREGSATLLTDSGMLTLKEVFTKQGVICVPGQVVESAPSHPFSVLTPSGYKEVSGLYAKQVEGSVRITSHAACRIIGTPNHPVRVLASTGLIWKPLDQLEAGDALVGYCGKQPWAGKSTALLSTADAVYSQCIADAYHNNVSVRFKVPTKLTKELAWLLGVLVADGCIRSGSFMLSSSNGALIRKAQLAFAKCFPDYPLIQLLDAKVKTLKVCSRFLRLWLHLACGFSTKLLCRSRDKQIPQVIRSAPEAFLLEFLSGYLSCDSEVTSIGLSLCSASETLIRQLVSVLASMGFAPGKVSNFQAYARNGSGRVRTYHSATYPALSIAPLFEQLEFLKPAPNWRKAQDQRRLPQVCLDAWKTLLAAFQTENSNTTYVRLHAGERIRCTRKEFLPVQFGGPRSHDKVHLTRRALHAVNWDLAFRINPDAARVLRFSLRADVWLSEVTAVEVSTKKRWVYDICVPDGHQFVADGIVNHNTFLLKMMRELPGIQVYYTAPTNKAAKVLGRFVGEKGTTTYSRLGLRLQQDENDENAPMVLVPAKDPPYLMMGAILVVDECGMVGVQLREAIEAAQERCGLKVMYVGDPAQLPPVNEEESGSWHCTDDPKCRAILKQVMRYDSALLTLATAIRECIKAEDWNTPLAEDINEDGTGVFKFKTERAFKSALFKDVPKIDWSETKVLAWRNKTVEYYNAEIRSRLGFNDAFNVGDHLLLAAPILEDGVVVRHTDEELVVKAVRETNFTVQHLSIPVWELECEDEDGTAQPLRIACDANKLSTALSYFAQRAKATSNQLAKRDAWKFFWDLKARFHRVRFGYALTSHRAQGSTYTNVWVDQSDVLANRDKAVAFSCLYVDATRPTTNLYSF